MPNFASTENSRSSLSPYRPDIDGLRAISVIAVILFHTGLGCPGGYVGVDVFFVISGFLITGLIVKEVDKGTFALANFWERRCRRIIPAVFAMTLGALAMGYWLLRPYHYIQMAKSAIAQAFFGSNFFFWRDRNYFNQESEWKPLLHTWSLSVEEQFYILLPFLLLGIHRWNRRWLVPVICIGTIASLILSCMTVVASPAACFYLLPTRAWELLAGTLLVVCNRRRTPKIVAEAMAILGILSICVGVFGYDRQTPFPGFSAILPVAGTMLILISNENSLTFLGRFLSHPMLVYLGKLSFALYLWHWPLLSISRYAADGQLSTSITIVVLIATLVVSWVTYHLIEQPIRYRKILATQTSLWVAVLCGWLSIIGISLCVYCFEGFPNRNPLANGERPETFPVSEIEAIRTGNLPVLGAPDNPVRSFIVWGDSHSAVNMPMMGELAKRRGLSGFAAAMSSSPPLPETMNGWNRDLMEWNKGVLDLIEQKDIKHVFLIARWASYVEEINKYDLLFGTDPLQTFVYDNMNSTKSTDVAFTVFQQSIRKLCNRLTTAGRHVYIVPQVPEQGSNYRHRQFIAERTWGWIPNTQLGISKQTHLARQRRVNQVFSSLQSTLVSVLNADESLFDSNERTILHKGDVLIYSDINHLTIEGTYFAIAPLLEPIFDTIAKSEKSVK